jgi:hypothetical protein
MGKWLVLALMLFASPAWASDLNLNNAYGQQVTGCIQGTVQTTGHNRLAIPATWANHHLLVWCEAAADFSVGDACRFVMGDVTIDVTGLTSPTRVGETVFPNQQRQVWATSGTTYISAVSKTASSKINVCKLN